jgi:hypothetical protein
MERDGTFYACINQKYVGGREMSVGENNNYDREGLALYLVGLLPKDQKEGDAVCDLMKMINQTLSRNRRKPEKD